MTFQRMEFLLRIIFCVVLSMKKSTATTVTLGNQCTYENSGITPVMTCDFALITLPLAYGDFTPQAQRLKISNVNGQLPATVPTATFSGWSSFNTGAMDTDVPASLEIVCASGGQLILFSGTFADMSYVQEVKITNCVLSGGLPNNVFSSFVELDALILDGGSINDLNFDTLSGLNITADLNVPNPKGLFSMTNLALGSATLPGGFFYPIKEVRSVIIDNVATPTSAYMSIPKDTFIQNTAMKVLSLSYNNFTYIENNILSTSGALSYFNMTGIKWECTCEHLEWFLSYIIVNQVEIIGGMVCDTPSNYQNQRATAYFNAECPHNDACGSTVGVVISGECFPALELAESIISFLLLVGACVILGVVDQGRRSFAKLGQDDNKYDKFKYRDYKNKKWSPPPKEGAGPEVDVGSQERKSNLGLVFSNVCFPSWQLANYALLILTFLVSALALGLIIATRFGLHSARMKLQMKKKSSWMKVQEALKRGGGGQKPPASTGPPKGAGWM